MSPIDLEIYWNRLVAMIDEANASLKRTSFSTAVRESNDCTVVLLDQDGRLLTQASWSVPGFIGTAPLTLRKMLELFPKETLQPDDVLFTNDPWIGTGHLPDTTMGAPIHLDGRIVGFVVTVAHVSDIGGRPWSADATEVFEEGIRFPVLKLLEGGRLNELVMSMLDANVRLPAEVRGDINAQIVAIQMVKHRLTEMLSEYGLKDLREIATAIYRASRSAALEEIRKIPPGQYIGEAETDGWNERVKIRATVTVSSEGIKVDYTGSSPQVDYGFNETFNHTFSFTLLPFKCMLSPHVPNNDGFTSLFEVHAPEGSVVNARHPAAVGARHLIGHVIPAAIFDALSPVIPERVQADSGTPMWSVVLRGIDARCHAAFSTILFFAGGMGAMKERDGPSATSFPANISNAPIEVVESLAPVLFTSKRLNEGTGGAGAKRGGAGQVVAFKSRWPGTIRVSLLTDRVKVPARGLLGGEPGKVGHVKKNGSDVAETKGFLILKEGDVLELGLPGGGGFGEAMVRA